VLGLIELDGETYTATEDAGGKTVPGLIIYRFESAIVFFNADYFSDRVRTLVRNAQSQASSYSMPSLCRCSTYRVLMRSSELATQGIVFGVARARGLFRIMIERAGVAEKIGSENLFHTVHAGAESFRRNGNVSARAVED
jgi:MFS superfamily sulfate permease-like transporter